MSTPTSADKPGPVKTVPNFDARRYMGDWYEYARTDNWFEWGLKCCKANYTLKTDTNNQITGVNVTNSGVRNYPFLWKNTSASIQATLPDPSQPAALRVGGGSGPANYYVVATDYESYSAVYSPMCFLFGKVCWQNAWILVRDKQGPTNPALIEKAYAELEKNGIKREALLKTVQDCDN